MNDMTTVGSAAAGEISKAVSGIEALLKQLHTTAQDHGVLYGIMSNLATIRMVLVETSSRATSD